MQATAAHTNSALARGKRADGAHESQTALWRQYNKYDLDSCAGRTHLDTTTKAAALLVGGDSRMSYYIAKNIDAAFADAVTRTKTALAAQGFGVLSEIDVAATLRAKIGAEIGQYLILGACNPEFAHRALLAEPKIGTLLPCNVVVREASPGHVEVAAVDPVASMSAVENPALKETADAVRELLRRAIADI